MNPKLLFETENQFVQHLNDFYYQFREIKLKNTYVEQILWNALNLLEEQPALSATHPTLF